MRVIAALLCLAFVTAARPAAAGDAHVSYTITNGGVDTKGTEATGQFHIHPAGHHDGDTISWSGSSDPVDVPEGSYDVEITFSDGAAQKTVWLDNQKLTGTVSKTIEIGIPMAVVSYTVTNGGVDTKGTQATGQFHLRPAGHHDGSVISWAGSGDSVRVPAGNYDVQITFSDGAAEKTIWLDNQSIAGTVSKSIEAGVEMAQVTFTVTNDGVDTKGTAAEGQFHLRPAGRHDGEVIAWGGSGDSVRVPAGDYDVQITFNDGASHREVWFDKQTLRGNVARTVEAGVPTAEVTYTITNDGVDTKGTAAEGQFHLRRAGRHDGEVIAWGGSGDSVRVPAGDYDVQITFNDGASHREIWLDKQTMTGKVARTVEAGVATADVTYTITNNGEDTKGTGATGQFHLRPAGHHDGPVISWAGSSDHVRVPAGDYDVQITYSQGLVQKEVWKDKETLSGKVARTVELGLVFTKPTVTVTRDGTDLAGKAEVAYYPPGKDNSLGAVRASEEALLEQGHYDIRARYEDAEGWLRDQALTGSPHLSIAIAIPKVQTLSTSGPPPKACTIEVYGVNFDFDKSTLRPDSEPVLKQVLALFTTIPGFAAEVGGHTDNVGTSAYNLRLSDARAAAVKTWLVKHGLAANRVTSRGYGDTQPLVPNTTDENRFKNRRVELKRTNCQ